MFLCLSGCWTCIIDSTILFPNSYLAFRMPQTAYPSFPDFLLGLSSQLEKHHRFPVFTNLQGIDNRQSYIIPKPQYSLQNASNCLSIISKLLSGTIWSIGKHHRFPVFTNLQWIKKLSGDAQTLSFEINNNSKSLKISRHIYIPWKYHEAARKYNWWVDIGTDEKFYITVIDITQRLKKYSRS